MTHSDNVNKIIMSINGSLYPWYLWLELLRKKKQQKFLPWKWDSQSARKILLDKELLFFYTLTLANQVVSKYFF